MYCYMMTKKGVIRVRPEDFQTKTRGVRQTMARQLITYKPDVSCNEEIGDLFQRILTLVAGGDVDVVRITKFNKKSACQLSLNDGTSWFNVDITDPDSLLNEGSDVIARLEEQS